MTADEILARLRAYLRGALEHDEEGMRAYLPEGANAFERRAFDGA